MNKIYTSLLFFCFLAFFFSEKLIAQDLIVTTQGDSINAEIIKVTEDFIQYVYMDGKKVIRVKSNKADIKSFRYIYYSQKRKVEYTFDLNKVDFRLGFSGGASWGTDGPPEDATQFFKDYSRKVNSGWSYKIELNYFLKNKRIGVGGMFENFITEAKIEDVTFTNTQTGETRVGVLSDDVRIKYLGPLVTYHLDTKKENFTVYFGAGTGAVWYRNEFQRVDTSFASGSTVGFHLSASADLILMNNFMIGFELSATLASLSNVSIEDDNGITRNIDESNDITRINLSVGIRFTK